MMSNYNPSNFCIFYFSVLLKIYFSFVPAHLHSRFPGSSHHFATSLDHSSQCELWVALPLPGFQMASHVGCAPNTFSLFSFAVIYWPLLASLKYPLTHPAKEISLIIRGNANNTHNNLLDYSNWHVIDPLNFLCPTELMTCQIHTSFIEVHPISFHKIESHSFNHQVLMIQPPKYMLNLCTFFLFQRCIPI